MVFCLQACAFERTSRVQTIAVIGVGFIPSWSSIPASPLYPSDTLQTKTRLWRTADYDRSLALMSHSLSNRATNLVHRRPVHTLTLCLIVLSPSTNLTFQSTHPSPFSPPAHSIARLQHHQRY